MPKYIWPVEVEIIADNTDDAQAKLNSFREAAYRADGRYGAGDVSLYRVNPERRCVTQEEIARKHA